MHLPLALILTLTDPSDGKDSTQTEFFPAVIFQLIGLPMLVLSCDGFANVRVLPTFTLPDAGAASFAVWFPGMRFTVTALLTGP